MESSVLCGASAPLFQRALNRAYLPTFTGEESYLLGLRMVRRLGSPIPTKKWAFQTGRRERRDVMPLGKERAQVARVQHDGAHQAFDMPSHLP